MWNTSLIADNNILNNCKKDIITTCNTKYIAKYFSEITINIYILVYFQYNYKNKNKLRGKVNRSPHYLIFHNKSYKYLKINKVFWFKNLNVIRPHLR